MMLRCSPDEVELGGDQPDEMRPVQVDREEAPVAGLPPRLQVLRVVHQAPVLTQKNRRTSALSKIGQAAQLQRLLRSATSGPRRPFGPVPVTAR